MLIIGTAFIACQNNDDDDSSSSSNSSSSGSGSSSTTGTSTSGSVAAASGGVATLSAANGTYVFTSTSSGSASVRAAVDTSKSGNRVFKNKLGKVKYSGEYKGDIDKLASEEVKFDLKVEKGMDFLGEEKAVKEEKSFDLDAGTSSFEAKIPEVEVPQRMTMAAMISLGDINTMDGLVTWLNTYAQVDTGSTFTSNNWVSEQKNYKRYANSWVVNETTREVTLDVDRTETSTINKVQFNADGSGKYYYTADSQTTDAGTFKYTISADGKTYVILGDDGYTKDFITSDTEEGAVVVRSIGPHPKLGSGTIKLQYVINGVEDMLEECSPELFVDTSEIAKICMDKEGTKTVSFSATVAGTSIAYYYTPYGEEAKPLEPTTQLTFYVIITNN